MPYRCRFSDALLPLRSAAVYGFEPRCRHAFMLSFAAASISAMSFYLFKDSAPCRAAARLMPRFARFCAVL